MCPCRLCCVLVPQKLRGVDAPDRAMLGRLVPPLQEMLEATLAAEAACEKAEEAGAAPISTVAPRQPQLHQQTLLVTRTKLNRISMNRT